NVIGRADKGHPPVAWRPVDGHARVLQPGARLVNVVDLVGEVAEVASAAIAVLAPIVGQLDLAALIAGNTEENKGEAALFILHPPPLFQPEQLEEADRGFGVRYAD